MARVIIACPSCGAGTYLAMCARCRDLNGKPAIPPPVDCAQCGVRFTPRNRLNTLCSMACGYAYRLEVASTERRRRAAQRAEAKRAKVQRVACASCEHGRLSRSSETGYACGIEAAMRCRPHGPAVLYLSWEAQAHG